MGNVRNLFCPDVQFVKSDFHPIDDRNDLCAHDSAKDLFSLRRLLIGPGPLLFVVVESYLYPMTQPWT